MRDELFKIEKEILDTLYKKDYENNIDLKIDCNMFSLEGGVTAAEEVGYYLERLESLNYLDCEIKYLLKGGAANNKYNSNVIVISWNKIHLSYKGKNYVEEERLTFGDKVKIHIKEFFKDVFIEMRSKIISHLVSFLLGIIVTCIYFLIGRG